MPRTHIQPTDRESRFDPAELFFSTTDHSGRIRSGNDVFCRVSGYALADMLGRPHSLVRHPDMPRAVFALLWERVLAGRTIAAYVKNLAADGSYYWVLATVTPIPGQDGFLSVRVKPTSEIFPAVRTVYARLREIEAAHEADGDRATGMAASSARLGELLTELGFADYDTFMQSALPTEIGLRERGLAADRRPDRERRSTRASGVWTDLRSDCASVAQQLDDLFAKLDGFLALSRKLDEKSRFVSELARSIRLASMNAMASCRRVAGSSETLGVIASAIGTNAEHSSTLAVALERQNATAARALRRAAFHISTSKLQMEMIANFVAELSASADAADGDDTVTADRHAGLDALIRCVSAEIEQVFEALEIVRTDLAPLSAHLTRLRQLIRTLAVTHLTGMIESNHVAAESGFGELFAEMRIKIEQARDELRDFTAAVQESRRDIEVSTEARTAIEHHLEPIRRFVTAAV